MWRPGFDYVESEPAMVKGWSRRFWQGSPDHRGTDANPGRVVTLIRAGHGCCLGMGFRLRPKTAAQIFTGLDHREQGGYSRIVVEMTLASGRRQQGVTYLAMPGNPHYLGPAPLPRMAAHILRAQGPSGANSDYLWSLERTLIHIGEIDLHVQALSALARGLTLSARDQH